MIREINEIAKKIAKLNETINSFYKEKTKLPLKKQERLLIEENFLADIKISDAIFYWKDKYIGSEKSSQEN